MKRIAMIKDGVVENICIWDGISVWNPGDNYLLIDVTQIPCEIGWISNQDGTFSDPNNQNQ